MFKSLDFDTTCTYAMEKSFRYQQQLVFHPQISQYSTRVEKRMDFKI